MAFVKTLSRDSATVSLADGVPVKLNEKWRPPSKVMLPIDFEIGNPSEVLFMEYDFSLEENVVQWSEHQREISRQTDLEQNKDLEKMDELNECDKDTEEFIQRSDNAKQSESQSGTLPPSAMEDLNKDNTISDGNPVPFFQKFESGSMLLPTPLIPTNMPVTTSMLNSPLDLRDFEREQDPFENLELKTLNDMEELDKVLQKAQESVKLTDNVNVTLSDNTSNPTENRAVPQGVLHPGYQESSSKDNISNNMTTNPFEPVNSQDQKKQVSNIGSNLKNIEYPSLDSLPDNQNSLIMQMGSGVVSYKNVSPPDEGKTIDKGMDSLGNSNSHHHTMLQLKTSGQNSKMHSIPSTIMNSTSTSVHDATVIPQNKQYSFNGISNGFVSGTMHLSQTEGKVDCGVNPLRSTRSTPDIVDMAKPEHMVQTGKSHTPPPYISNVATTNSMAHASQSWDMYSQRNVKSVERPQNIPTSVEHKPTVPNQLPNPYEDMSFDAKRFINGITDMGFSRACVSRIVKRLGQDDKKVIDHLCHVNRMIECHPDYNSVDVEVAADLFNEDSQVSKYLTLLSQFRELGFSDKEIRQALQNCCESLDHENVLDALTSS